MTRLFISLGNLLQPIVIRDSETHLNGDPVLTKTNSVFADIAQRAPRQSKSKESTLYLARVDDPDYYGFLTKQISNSLFMYGADGKKQLSADRLTALTMQKID
jgi:hypothetical protein